jgi:hypothetical protein
MSLKLSSLWIEQRGRQHRVYWRNAAGLGRLSRVGGAPASRGATETVWLWGRSADDEHGRAAGSGVARTGAVRPRLTPGGDVDHRRHRRR